MKPFNKDQVIAALIAAMPNAHVVERGQISEQDRQDALRQIRRMNSYYNHRPMLGNGALQRAGR